MITGKDIRRELQGNFAMYTVIVLVFAAIAAFCTVFCGTQLGWTHLFTIIGIAACGIAAVAFIIIMIKLIMVRSNKLFRKYGSADAIAQKINEGTRSYRFRSRKLLITDNFIVNEGNYSGYMETKDIRSIRPEQNREENLMYVGTSAAGTIAKTASAYYVNKMYRQSAGITETNHFDNLHIVDTDGVHHYYSVHCADMNEVLQVLRQVAPNAEITMS